MLKLELLDEKQDILIDGSHKNFVGTPLEGQDFNILIGDDYDRLTYTKLARELMKNEAGEHDTSLANKAIFMLSIREHDIVIGDVSDKYKVLDIIYDDRKRLPQILYATIQEEVDNYHKDVEKKSEEDVKILNGMENGSL